MKFPLLAAVPLVLVGCAQMGVKQAEEHPPVVQVEAERTMPPLPAQPLSEEVLYTFLLGEIAGQRGDADVSAEAFLRLARNTRDPRLAERATEATMQAGYKREALEAARLWQELDPESVPARQALASLLLENNRAEEALPHLQKLMARFGRNPGQAFMHVGSLVARLQDKPAGLRLMRALVEPYRDLPEAQFALAQAAWGAGEQETGLAAIRRALQLRPNWDVAVLAQGQMLLRSSPEKALAYYNEVLRENPRNKDVRLSYARLLVGEKRYDQALQEFRRLSSDFPDNADIDFALGLLSIQLNDPESAERYLKQSLEHGYREEDTVQLYLGQLTEELKRYDEAAKWYKSIDGAQRVTGQVRYALMLGKQQKLAEARDWLQKVEVSNNQQRVQVTLAESQLLRDAKLFTDAYNLLTRALDKLPNYPELLYDHAMAAEKVNRLDVLEQDLVKLIQLKPDYAHAYNALGFTLADRTDRLEEAQKYVQKALELAPDDPFIMDSMGWVQYRMGKFDKAVALLTKAWEVRPDPEIGAHLGEALWADGKHEDAKKIWRAALKDNPDHEVLLSVMKRFIP